MRLSAARAAAPAACDVHHLAPAIPRRMGSYFFRLSRFAPATRKETNSALISASVRMVSVPMPKSSCATTPKTIEVSAAGKQGNNGNDYPLTHSRSPSHSVRRAFRMRYSNASHDDAIFFSPRLAIIEPRFNELHLRSVSSVGRPHPPTSSLISSPRWPQTSLLLLRLSCRTR